MFFLITLIIIIIAYYLCIRYIEDYSDHIEIIQSGIENFNADLLLEKQPIVIDDNIFHLDEFINNIMSGMYTRKCEINPADSMENIMSYKHFRINRYRYLLLHNNAENEQDIMNDLEGQPRSPIDITIAHPINVLPNNKNKIELSTKSDRCGFYKTQLDAIEPYMTKDDTITKPFEKIIIKLHPGQVLILPYKWYYHTSTPIHEIYLNDILYSMNYF